MCIYVCVHACTHVYLYSVRSYVCAHVYMSAYMYVVCVCTCLCVYFCLYMCVYACVICVCVEKQKHGNACPYVCRWRPEVDAGLIYYSVPCALRQGLTLNLELTVLVRWTASEP